MSVSATVWIQRGWLLSASEISLDIKTMKIPTIFHLAFLWWRPTETKGRSTRTSSVFPTSLYKNTWASPADCEYSVLALLWDRVAVMMLWHYQTESSKHIYHVRRWDTHPVNTNLGWLWHLMKGFAVIQVWVFFSQKELYISIFRCTEGKTTKL